MDSIRTFDIDTQRSVENLKFIEVYPAEQMLADKSIFNDAADNLYKEYTAQVKRLVKKGDDFTEAAENLTKRRDELCEYIRNVSNLQLLENYLHYFYEKNRVSLGLHGKGIVIVDDPDRICEYLDTRSAETKDDFKVFLERGQVIPKDMELVSGKEDFLRSTTGNRCTY